MLHFKKQLENTKERKMSHLEHNHERYKTSTHLSMHPTTPVILGINITRYEQKSYKNVGLHVNYISVFPGHLKIHIFFLK